MTVSIVKTSDYMGKISKDQYEYALGRIEELQAKIMEKLDQFNMGIVK